MNVIKKSLAVLLAALILASVFSLTAYADEAYSVIASSAQGVFSDTSKSYKAGDEFEVKFYVRADEALSEGKWYVRFDNSALFAAEASLCDTLTSDSNYYIDGPGDAVFQEDYGYISGEFSDDKGFDFTSEKMFFTVKFQVRSEIAENQNVSLDIKTFSGVNKASEKEKYIEK